MVNLPEEFKQRMKTMLRGDYGAFCAAMESPAVRGLRVNTLKIGIADFLARSLWPLSPSGLMPESFILDDPDAAPKIGLHPYHMAGLFYMQEPSACAAVELLDPKPGMRVLDLCAAPGGKAGAIAARLKGEGLLVANEPVYPRAKILQGNLERLGVTNAVVTAMNPKDLCPQLTGCFDAVLVDAPCSGEGMFRKDPDAAREWSIAQVKACAIRQRAILESACAALKRGGALVYSTCTFSREENEDVIEGFLSAHPEFRLEGMRRMYPHACLGEGHFAARLVKTAGEAPKSFAAMKLPPCVDPLYQAFLDAAFLQAPAGKAVCLGDGRVFLLSCDLPAGLMGQRILSSGVYAGELLKGRLEPAHALFMACHRGRYANTLSFAPESLELFAFLHGDALELPTLTDGFHAVTVDGFPLGFGKAVSGTLKNHLPKAIRLR